MGGKTKQALRTKNNAKPSSSSRSAEQLGTTAPFFVGFSAQPDGNLVPFAPGFESAEQMPDTFDASIDPQIQIILRKLAKKDPMTKKKALQELHELITACDLESLKNILPLWPKYYHNLANDIEHAVREQAQLVQQLLFLKCGRAMAPFLKQLVPVWLGSRYDSYAPAASIARNSFRETFARTCEVCLHCQYEIIEYCSRNLSVYTPTTLSIGKHLKPEESEQKYQRVVMSSLKALSFFVEQTSKTTEQENIKQGLAALLAHVKFWTFAKHKHPSIRAAWFECIYRLLQCVTLLEVITPYKSQLIAATFQSIDDSDPLVVPHVWACVLLLQINFEDWYSSLNIRKTLLPKLSTLLRNGFNQNAQAICPNLLPFLSKISAASLHDLDIYEFYMRFFEDFKSSVLRPRDPLLFKSDTSIKHRAYFECLRFILQNINKSTNSTASVEEFALRLLEQQILEPIKELLRSDGDNVRYYFQHTSALVAFWDRECNKNINKNSCVVYVKLLNLFWARIIEHIPLELANKDVNEQFLSNVLILLQELHVANPSLETPCVKFLDAVEQPLPEQTTPQSMPSIKVHEPACFIEKELKELTVKLVCICMENARNSNDSNCFISRVRTLTKLFTDAEFYKSLTPLEDLKATLDKFIELLLLDKLSDDACDSVVGIIFEILSLLKPDERFAYIAETLLKIRQHRVQNMLLQRLLSYPLCTEPAVRQMLGSPESCAAIDRIAKEIVVDSNKDKLNLLQKCFFQTDAGDILINKSTVDQILLVMCAPLEQSDASEMLEICGSFIAQIMPVAFGKENSSPAVRQHVFLKLYKFSLEQKVSHHLSEDTLWEITTCWQDALLSNDIEINKDLLQCCSDIAEKLAQCSEMNASSLESMAGIISEFIISLTKNIDDESQRSNYLEETILAMLSSKVKTTNSVLQFEQHCVFLETLKFSTSPGVITECAALNETNILPLLRRTKLNFAIITKLVCCAGGRQQSNKCEDELNEDFYDPNDNLLKQWSEPFILELMQCMQVQAAAQTWLEAYSQINEACKELVVSLSIQVSCFMGNGSELVGIIKQRLQQEALKENSVMGCRLLGQLVHYSQYAAFEENAAIILHDDLAELLIQQGALRAYVMTLQHLLPKLSQKALNLNSAIMRSEPPVMWVKAAVFRCLLLNNFESELNNKADYHIIVSALQFLTRVGELQNTQKELLHYNVELLKQPYEEVLNTLEIIKLLNEVLQRFPHELNIKNWDLLRIGLSSWVLTVSKSIKYYNDPKTSYFIAAVYQLFATLSTFIRSEKQKSSTELLKNVIDEWESLFATEVNVLLFKAYYDVIHESTVPVEFCACFEALLECLMPGLEMLDYSFVYRYFKTPNSKHTLDHLCNFLLKQLHSSQHSVRVNAAYALRQLTLHFVADEIELYDQNSNNTNAASKIFKWHFLNRFEDYLNRYDALISIYLKDFSFKLSELDDLKPIDKNDAYSYLLLWDCIINACAKSPVMLRSIYTSWLNENQYETNFLNFLFRVMPVDILKNHSAKVHSNSIYKDLSWSQLKDSQLSVERYACHLYTEVLRKLPAVVRKWWNTRQSRQKNFVDNLTTNYVSALICSEELNAIANRKEKHENMQVTVHKSTREVLAVYAMDEARMELVISLAPNYPLGAVKVECGKQIGGRASSRNVGMQLTIFLTHQNGTIYDGLTLWKNNLDKKFDGVEECYICYTVIHQDTCQLPKLTCKTCKKKFHGPCLYKWFTTSSKSTCPICRNVF